ncbi:uncharacterized protein FRV6_02764 [Fusarium oxysporum]|uniref:Clr5 domain-containing protein n=1 Tax=Fusarium oxysporum TaxID=5507 RepID=A0A2H3SQW1_FUSOX|nr:uncharacterized protein FRV6_02764 [Fusarium oxysporum]
MSAAQSQPSEGDWLEYKNLIRYEYLFEDRSLKELVTLLRAQGLRTTFLKSWNISKNLDKETWQYIGRKIDKRKKYGKDSDVIHCGRIMKKLKIAKETNRHRETNFVARFKTRQSNPCSDIGSNIRPNSAAISNEPATQHLYSASISF